jgi:ferric-dicitrate binding protein FerR (iron transport regulator)
MNKLYFNELLQKLDDGTITPEERSLLESWYSHYAAQSSHIMDDEDVESSVASMRNNLQLNRKPFIKKLWPRIAIASAVACVVIGAYFFRSSFMPTDKGNTAYVAADIAPGKNGATLTLANGTKILINDALAGNIASQSGVKISKSKDGQIIYEVTDQGTNKNEYNTLTTTRGEQTQVRLPDGSLVFLNAASSLRYPTSFAKTAQRRVSLTGEGYFEVAKSKSQSFVVSTAKQEVEVLGTHFNINAYGDENAVKTTLLEGSVRVAMLSATGSGTLIGNPQILKPGQQSVLDEKGLEVVDVDLDEAVSWQKGYFRFYDEDIATVMRKVSRWYNVEVEYSGEMTKVGFTARITKYSSIKDVLGTLEKTKAVHFKIEGRKVIVSNY